MLSRSALAALAAALLPLAAAAESTETPLARNWDQALRGKRLTQMSSYSSGSAGGYAMRADLYLCRDGRFYFERESSVAVYGGGAMGSSGGRGAESGTWRVVSEGDVAALHVRLAGGEEGYMVLERTPKGTFVNGERTFVTNENPACP